MNNTFQLTQSINKTEGKQERSMKMVRRNDELDMEILKSISGCETGNMGFQIENQYFMRERRENLFEAGCLDSDEIPGMSTYERTLLRSQYCMETVEQERTNRKLPEYQFNEEDTTMATEKKNDMQLLQFKTRDDEKMFRIGEASVKLTKIVSWDKSRRGIVNKSFIKVHLENNDEIVGTLLIGAKDGNLWVGKVEDAPVAKQEEFILA